jgi:hypothetical protein
MFELQTPKDSGFGTCWSTIADLPADPLAAARELFKKCACNPQPGLYSLVDNRSGYRHPMTKAGKPSKRKKWVKEETVLGQWTADELKEESL